MIELLFIQGAGEGAHMADASLAASLAGQLGPEYRLRYPRMPREEDPAYSAWASAFSKELAVAAPPLVMVGHSLGASFVLRYLALNEVEPKPLGVFLAAAPFIGDQGWQGDFELPAQAGTKLRQLKLFFFQGTADEVVPAAHLRLYEKTFPCAQLQSLPDRNHQLDDDMTELAAAIRSMRSMG